MTPTTNSFEPQSAGCDYQSERSANRADMEAALAALMRACDDMNSILSTYSSGGTYSGATSD